MRNRNGTGAMVAAAAALLLTTAAPAAEPAEEVRIKCDGVNSCKHTSACKTAHNSCAGQNKCRGQEFLMLGKSECDAARAKLGKSG